MNKKIIVITGCSKQSGVGYQLAQELLGRDHHVIATVRNLSTSELQPSNCVAPSHFQLKCLDLNDQGSIQSFIRDVLQEHQYIDVLVNNAAEVVVGAVETTSMADMQTTFQTKVFAPVALIQGFLPSMRQRRQGLFITTSSMFCTSPFPNAGLAMYLGALNAFERIQESLAVEVAPWNINVINFQPGPIKTNLSRHDGSLTDITDRHYPNYLSDAYSYFDRFDWQDPRDVAKVYADIIETQNPSFSYQSSSATTDFVKQYRRDPTCDSYFNELSNYFIERAKTRTKGE